MESAQSTYGPLTIHEKAYLFFPTPKQQKTEFTKKGARFFYYGQIQHDEYEKKKIKEFYEYVEKNKVDYDKKFYNEQKILLFLQSHNYKPKETLEGMANHLVFRKEFLPVDFSRVEKMLKSGFFYPSGRDKNFRPVVVFNATLIDWKDLDTTTAATCFIQQELMKNTLLPGQVQNWVFIYDLGGMGITQLPMGAIKKSIGVMSANYGGRLYKMFVVNAPGSIYFSWKVISGFCDPVTAEKVNIYKKNTDKAIFDNIDLSQVEQKYGGTQPNRKQFWPLRIPEAVYDEKRLISWQEYEAKLKKGELKKNTIHPKFVENKQ